MVVVFWTRNHQIEMAACGISIFFLLRTDVGKEQYAIFNIYFFSYALDYIVIFHELLCTVVQYGPVPEAEGDSIN